MGSTEYAYFASYKLAFDAATNETTVFVEGILFAQHDVVGEAAARLIGYRADASGPFAKEGANEATGAEPGN